MSATAPEQRYSTSMQIKYNALKCKKMPLMIAWTDPVVGHFFYNSPQIMLLVRTVTSHSLFDY